MRSAITIAIAALALGTASASVPAFAQSRQTAPSYSNTGPWSAPLSPGGIGVAADAFVGAGYAGR
jgi:hypothetical protein